MTNDDLRNVMTTVNAMQTANEGMKKQYKCEYSNKIDASTFQLEGWP